MEDPQVDELFSCIKPREEAFDEKFCKKSLGLGPQNAKIPLFN
jgi:hypothetical protein